MLTVKSDPIMLMNNSRVVYIGNFDFPDNTAAGKRVHGMCHLFRSIGYESVLLDTKKNGNWNSWSYDNFRIISMPSAGSMRERLSFYGYYKKIVEQLQKTKSSHGLAAIVLYGSPCVSLLNLMLLIYCRNNKIPVIADCVDFLSTNTNNTMFNVFKICDEYLQKRIINTHCDGVIAISGYIAGFYQKFGPTVVIPPISQLVAKIERSKRNVDSPIRITYAGVPYRLGNRQEDYGSLKDRIDLIIKVFHSCAQQGLEFDLHFFGFFKHDLLQYFPSLEPQIDECKLQFHFHGPKSNKDVTEFIVNSDFTVLFRDEKRDSLAGFPTKVSESVVLGTPVIVTDVGDIGLYIGDTSLGFLSKPNDWNGQLDSVLSALLISRADLEVMKENCLKAGGFKSKNYESKLTSFLAEVLL